MHKEHKLNEEKLREFIRTIISEEVPDKKPAAAGADIKGGAAADRAAQLFKSNKQLVGLTSQIKDVNSLASFIQDIIGTVITPDESGKKKLAAKDALISIKKILDPLSKAAAAEVQAAREKKQEEKNKIQK
jgi:hypothetical protein